MPHNSHKAIEDYGDAVTAKDSPLSGAVEIQKWRMILKIIDYAITRLTRELRDITWKTK